MELIRTDGIGPGEFTLIDAIAWHEEKTGIRLSKPTMRNRLGLQVEGGRLGTRLAYDPGNKRETRVWWLKE